MCIKADSWYAATNYHYVINTSFEDHNLGTSAPFEDTQRPPGSDVFDNTFPAYLNNDTTVKPFSSLVPRRASLWRALLCPRVRCVFVSIVHTTLPSWSTVSLHWIRHILYQLTPLYNCSLMFFFALVYVPMRSQLERLCRFDVLLWMCCERCGSGRGIF
jgi:hypothetical protein